MQTILTGHMESQMVEAEARAVPGLHTGKSARRLRVPR
jgi:hypothetical protein